MPAPTEAEIRAILQAVEEEIDENLGEVVNVATSLIDYEVPERRGEAYSGSVWDDLRESEANRLRLILDECAHDLYKDLTRLIIDRVTAAALTFAAEYPDAPRLTRETVLHESEDALRRPINLPKSDPSPISPL